jgi:HEAT repeat protein
LWEFYLRDSALALLIFGNLIFGAAATGLALVAVALRISNDSKARRWQRLEKLWEPFALEVVVGLAQPEQLWTLVGPQDRLRFVNYLLRFAKRVSGSERRIVDDLAAPYLDLLLPQLGWRTPERRARAVQTLSTLGSRRYVDVILKSLDDPSPLVAMVAARSLARTGSPEYAAGILSRMHRFDQWRPSFLASMLATMGPAVAPALRTALADTTYAPTVRSVAADALRELNDYVSADAAALVLEEATDRNLIAAALNLMAHVGRAEHLPAVRRHATSKEPIVRARAIAALGHVGAPEDLPFIVGAFHDDSAWVVLRAGEALIEAGATDKLEALARMETPGARMAQQLLAGKPACCTGSCSGYWISSMRWCSSTSSC